MSCHAKKRESPNAKYCQIPNLAIETLAKFMNHVMNSGKKSVAETIVYGAWDRITKDVARTPLKFLTKPLKTLHRWSK